MIIGEPTLKHERDDVVLAAELVPEGGSMRPLTLWLAVPREYEDWLDPTANAFVPMATALSTTIGEDLRIEAPVSPQLARGAERAGRLYAEWWGYRPAAIDAVSEAPAQAAGPAGGVFFSCGVDSTTTLIRSLEGTIPERVTHLLSMQAINPHYSRRTERRVWQGIERAAAEWGLPLVRLRTNGTQVLRERMGWTRSFGADLASAGLAIGPLLRNVLFAATVDDDHPRPRGSHPDLDPLWGTERTTFRQDATEMGKSNRVLFVAGYPLALRHLKVCWETDTAGNCGRCFKCLMTMTAFSIGESRDWEQAFDAPLTPQNILSCDLKRGQVWKLNELYPALPPELDELRAAWVKRIREVEEHGPRRSWSERRARELRHRSRHLRRTGHKAWRRTRKRAGAVLGR